MSLRLTFQPDTRARSFLAQPWLPYAALSASILLIAAVFLFPSPREFPMDDTYIHFVYAGNLARYGQLFFNQPGEIGVGSTSLTWVLLLAGAARLGIPLLLSAKALGLLALLGVSWGLYALFRPLLGALPALALALLVSMSGHLLWFALSGMETVLFLALGILALLQYQKKRWAGLGLCLGALALTRPDGLALAAAIGLIELWNNRQNLRKFPRGLFLAWGICLLVCGPWFGYLFLRTGSILPTSAIGKQVSSLIGIRLILSRSPSFAFIARFPAILYFGTWVAYLLAFVLGGMALPGPGLSVGAEFGNAGYSISYTAMLAWAIVILPLLVSFGRGVATTVKSRDIQQDAFRPLWVLVAWLVLHNLAYAFFLPIPGTASRYGTINHLALWLILLLGLLRLRAHPRWFRLLAAGLVVIACANTWYWNQVYDANLEHMLNVRIAAAHYLEETLLPTDTLAAFDVGAVRFYTGRPVIDLGGLIDPALGEVYRADGRIDRYLDERGVQYVVLPWQTGTISQGWFDFAREMGLTGSSLFSLEQVRVFAISYERWLLGYLPTNNYQATVTIYRLNR